MSQKRYMGHPGEWMLKLKKVQILGFKSFCDRTEVQLAGAGIAAIVATLAPTLLLECAAGLALLRALGSALEVVGAATEGREAAVIAFIVTASQVSIAGIGSPFWGLVAGGFFTFLARRGRNADRNPRTRSADEAPDGTVTSAPS